MKIRLPLLALALGMSSPLVQAQMLQPGLWELTTSNMQVDGKPLPDMEFMLGQLKNLPPEQRAMIEGGLAKQGISVAGKGVRSCLTQQQVQMHQQQHYGVVELAATSTTTDPGRGQDREGHCNLTFFLKRHRQCLQGSTVETGG